MTLYLEGAALVAGCFALLWVASVIRRDASIVDPFWGLGFVVVVWVWYVRGDAATLRALAQAVAVTVWGVRLSGYLFWRNHGAGEDFRYRAMREKAPSTFPVASLFTVFLLQAAILVVVALPLHAVQRAGSPAGITPFDVAGLVVFLVGLTFESVGDLQMGSRPTPATAARSSTAGCGGTPGTRTTSATRSSGGACTCRRSRSREAGGRRSGRS